MADETLVVDTSFAQRSLWLQNQLDPGQPTYNVTSVVAIHGPLDATAVEYALNVVVDRHEALRTVFELDNGVPVQVIGPTLPLDVPVLDVAADDVQECVRAEVRKPFDLRTGPLLRFTLLRLAADHHVAVLVMHHIVTDGVSSALLFDEFATAYAARVEGRPADLPELPIQYADFAVWQRETLRGQALQELTDYWADRLAGIRAVFLPTDRPRPAAPGSDGGTVHFTIPARLTSRLEALARAQHATLFMVLLAGLDILLARYCRQHDITVTSPMAGRTRPELERLIGYFVNPVLLRVDLAGDPDFIEALGRVRATCVGAIEHQELPFEQVAELLRAEARSGVEDPAAQIMVVLQNMRRADWQIAGLVFEPLRVDTATAKVDLVVDLEPGQDGYDGMLEYRADIFDAATIERLAEHLLIVLEEVAEDPHQPISRINLLTQDERATALSSTATELVEGRIDAAFAEWAAKTPDTIAAGELTYADLDRDSTALAERLRAAGAAPGTVVALAIPPSTELLVAMLAVAKAGAAYLPLDPDDPPSRRAADVRATVDADLTITTSGAPPEPTDPDLARVERTIDGRLAASTHAEVVTAALALAEALGARIPVSGLRPAEFTSLAAAGLINGATLALTEPAPTGLAAQIGGYFAVSGRRLRHCRWYVLDEHGEPVPSVVPGELYLAGPAIGRPYSDADARFGPDPYGEGRRYRTGLLARLTSDDHVELLGRVDGLLDVDGEVVDPAEIEAAIAAVQSVAECAVISWGEPARLVAYVVPPIGARVDAAQLRDALAESLPQRLIPGSIVEVGLLPRDADGALDLTQVPAPETEQSAEIAEYVAPRTPFEEEVAAIWSDLLERERIGIHDNFFDLGGQSLTAVLIAARIRDRFGVDVVVRDLYANFTVAETAWKVLERVMADQEENVNPTAEAGR
ncbi:MAG TPA: condensation domain-containing protein [Pseudonocardiaceae bacterium]